MAVRAEYECTGTYTEVVARMRLSLDSSEDLRGRLTPVAGLMKTEFEIGNRWELWVHTIQPRARGWIADVHGKCVAEYKVGATTSLQIALGLIAILAVVLAVASWFNLLPIERYMMVPGAVLILAYIGANQLLMEGKAHWIDRKLVEHLKG